MKTIVLPQLSPEADKSIVNKAVENGEVDKIIFFIKNDGDQLFRYIEKLKLQSSILNKFKLLKYIQFDFEAFLEEKQNNSKRINVNNLVDVLSEITYESADQYSLILDTVDKNILSDVIQQIIYAEVNLDTLLKEEKVFRQQTKYFLDYTPALKQIVSEATIRIEGVKTNNNISQKTRESILQNIGEINKAIDSASNAEMTIVLLAPRRAGKSVILNCFLGDEYAPTTQGKISVTSIEYQKSANGKYRISYDDSNRGNGVLKKVVEEFRDVKELSEKIDSLSEEVRLDRDSGYTLPEIVVDYIPRNDQTSFRNLRLVDTPGPNIAGTSKHRDIAQKWLRKADVIIFIFELEHERDNEVNDFFKEIKQYFEDDKKVYSLITVLNKLDKRYGGGDNVSVIRILDQLKHHLTSLGYQGCLTMGTSALEYYNANAIINKYGHRELATSNPVEFLNEFSRIIENNEDDNKIHVLSSLEKNIKDLKNFHSIKNPTLETLKEHSGVKRLIEYADYIATEKAAVEKLRALMFKIDHKLAFIKNEFLLKQLTEFESSKRLLDESISKLINDIRNINLQLQQKIQTNSFKNIIEKTFIALAESGEQILIGQYEDQVEDILDKLKTKRFSDKQSFKNAFSLSFSMATFEKEYQKVYNDMANEIKAEIEKKETILRDCSSEIQNEINTIKEQFKKQHNTTIDISLPSLPPTFSELPKFTNSPRINISTVELALNDSLKQEETFLDSTVSVVVNSLRTVWSWFDETYTPITHQQSTGDFYIDVTAFKNSMRGRSADVERIIRTAVQEHGNTLKRVPLASAEELEKKMSDQSKAIFDEYERMFTSIHEDLYLSREDAENKIKFLSTINEYIQPLIDRWSQIPLNN